MKRFLPSLALGLLALVAALPATAAEPARTDVLNLEAAPFRLAVVPVKGKLGFGGRLLTAELMVTNTSPRPLSRIGVRAVVFDPRGELRGFHLLSLPIDLAPGETKYALYRAPGVAVAPTDRLVLLPHLARGRGLAWQLESAEVERTLAALAESRGEVETLSRVTAQETEPPAGGIENPISECQTACGAEGTRCDARCRCGVSNFSCTCGSEQISTSCSCFQCPPGG